MSQKRSNTIFHISRALFWGAFVCLGFILYIFATSTPSEVTHTVEVTKETTDTVTENSLQFSRSFSSSTVSKSYININNSYYNLFLARSSAERAKGLSGRTKLNQNEGMFFVFPEEERHGFWMKDMQFPIDVLWLNKNGEVVYIVENMSPQSYPKSYYPDLPATFVVELPVGSVLKTHIKVGERIEGDVSGYSK